MAIVIQKKYRNRHNVVSDINVTPLIDVMLVLLVIFMITSPMMVSGIHVDLPESSSTPISEAQEPLVITINSNNKLFLMDTAIDKSELVVKLKAITKEKYDTKIFVKGDKVVSYGEIISVVSEINAAGFSKVALITNIKQDEK